MINVPIIAENDFPLLGVNLPTADVFSVRCISRSNVDEVESQYANVSVPWDCGKEDIELNYIAIPQEPNAKNNSFYVISVNFVISH
jgi:hypothetical protein